STRSSAPSTCGRSAASQSVKVRRLLRANEAGGGARWRASASDRRSRQRLVDEHDRDVGDDRVDEARVGAVEGLRDHRLLVAEVLAVLVGDRLAQLGGQVDELRGALALRADEDLEQLGVDGHRGASAGSVAQGRASKVRARRGLGAQRTVIRRGVKPRLTVKVSTPGLRLPMPAFERCAADNPSRTPGWIWYESSPALRNSKPRPNRLPLPGWY